MPLVGAAIAPHSPLLWPTIGKAYQAQVKKTGRALASLAQELYALRPQVIVVLHPHGPSHPGAFVLNVAEKLTVNLAEFGDLVTTAAWRGSPSLGHRIQERAEDHGFPVKLLYESTASYDAAIPLLTLPQHISTASILPIGSANLDPQAHVHWGSLLAEEFHHSRERVVVLASAELSHHASAAAPGGLRPEGSAFDSAVLKAVAKQTFNQQLLKIDPTTVELAEACGYRPLLILAGIIKRQRTVVRRLSYEHPFGIGLAVATIHLA
ncbi:MAG: AmmeMemoRadiSam system protein B [Candidatus Kerfeldbacteria bacterium]|nr:AmmeMemoRadiSam system protein B [Candidatus Kerfeldbacteria bacterium]